MLKRITITVLIALLSVFSFAALTGCASSSRDVLKQTVEQEFNSYKNHDDAVLEKIAKTAETGGLAELGISPSEFATQVLNGFDYTIDDIKIDGSTAHVTVTIVSKSSNDFQNKLNQGVEQFVSNAASSTLTAEQKSTQIGDIAMNVLDNTETVEETVDLTFELEDSVWVAHDTSGTLSKLDSLVFSS